MRSYFAAGSYLPLGDSGTFADCCVAFRAELEGKWIVVLAPRLSSRVGFPPIGETGRIPRWNCRSRFAREGIEIFSPDVEAHMSNELTLHAAEALAVFPFAVSIAHLNPASGAPLGRQPISPAIGHPMRKVRDVLHEIAAELAKVIWREATTSITLSRSRFIR